MAPPRANQYVIYVGFLAILAVFSILLRGEGFATSGNLVNIVQQTTPVTVMAVGTVFVLTAGEIDLSIGSTVAVSALLAALVLAYWPWPAGVLVGLGAGAAIGVLERRDGRLRETAIVSRHARHDGGVCRRRGGGSPTSDPFRSRTIRSMASSDRAPPSAFLRWSLWTIAAVGIGYFVFGETKFGAHVHATGDSADASRAGGIKVLRLRFAVMLMSGVLAALAGLLYADV